jgi:hypothetical protein
VHEQHNVAIARALIYVMNTKLSAIKIVDLHIIWSEGIIGEISEPVVGCA